MRAILALAFFVVVALAVKVPQLEEDIRVVRSEIVDHVNAAQTTWTASAEQGHISRLSKADAKKLMGVRRLGEPVLPRKSYAGHKLNIPASFDSRTNWPGCTTMYRIRDQSDCGSCWAFAAVEAMSDRYCIFLKQTNLSISAQDLNSCCDECGDGCDGGDPGSAWQYWVDTGLVDSMCAPYSLPWCDHHIPNSKNPCPQNEYPTPPCPSSCVNNEDWNSALHFGSTAYSVSGEDDIMAEVFQNGPVEVAFEVYEDFLSYKSGVYQHTTGDYLGGHAVKLLGWGTLNGTPYWLIANSWNNHWGDHGYFKILRGSDECGIEDEGDAGVPKS